jgi:hypothetical protein
LNFSRDRQALNATEALQAVDFVELSYVKQIDMSADIGSPGYDRPASRATAVVYDAVYSGQIVNADSPCGANCSLTQSFIGPSYKCTQLDQYDTDAPWCQTDASDSCADIVSDFNLTDPSKVIAYQAQNSSADFCSKYLKRPEACMQQPGDGDAWMDGTLWVRHKFLPQAFREGYNASSVLSNPTLPGSAWHNYTFRCEQWQTRFDIRRTWSNFQQHIDANRTSVAS